MGGSMYRRYIIVGVVLFLLIGAYFIFFDKKKGGNEYEKYYNKLVEREEFSSYLEDVNIDIKEEKESNSKYTYSVTFDGVSEAKENIKILILDANCSKEKIENFPSFGIVANKGYSLVKDGKGDEENKLLEGVNLSVSNKEKIDYFIIYFASGSNEEFVKVEVATFLD